MVSLIDSVANKKLEHTSIEYMGVNADMSLTALPTAFAKARLLSATIVDLRVAEADGHLRAHRNAWYKGYNDNAETSGMKGMDIEDAINIKTEYNVLCLCINT